jgi:hypothetical protein
MFRSGTRGVQRFQRVPVRGKMAGSAEKGREEVGLHGKGRNCPESKRITMRRCGERRSVWRVVETLKKREYVCKMGGYLYSIVKASGV